MKDKKNLIRPCPKCGSALRKVKRDGKWVLWCIHCGDING